MLHMQGGQPTAVQRDWLGRLIEQLQTLEAVEAVKLRSVAVHGDARLLETDTHATLLPWPFGFGMQGRSEAAAYEKAQASAAKTATLVFRLFFGDTQGAFASELLNAWQLRGSAWTTATVIS
jgi:hypothetical protein